MTRTVRVGIDLGGTKIAAIAFDEADEVLFRDQIAAPRDDYQATVRALKGLADRAEQACEAHALIGLGMPGSISPNTGLVQNANSTWLNGTAFATDLETALARPVRFANDANCLALSESCDGAAQGAACVFAVILGTGCGGGIVIDGALHQGRHQIAGEWGHTPLPWPSEDEHPGPRCWCGKSGCLETWISGPALSRDHEAVTGALVSAKQISTAAANGDDAATASLERHAERLARALACTINILDPDIVVIGGGLSRMAHLYDRLPKLVAGHIFADHFTTAIRPAAHGPESGVRGAARLWTVRECADYSTTSQPHERP